ncbi:NepR family anti-sigma factor [Stakelama pacifica]|uniref:Anti-sigma factor NepR domain-containing protein n=1 Tax=Stakelama pacifica TaxID=517720 RepID=A0A4R6FSD8_9SPHN|nr:NepR family anti-sigma factor [Stakelama pacifica]MAX00558.1 hypothetical protein [Sphingomonas sp.]TDN84592.1 hypothetical protein EV664_103238 [Stakelama pacifica]GGO93356.1 hypothetical protein GCM10011329_12590 [Stakelama pacifica]
MVRSDADRQQEDKAVPKEDKSPAPGKKGSDGDVGNALRAVYREAIDEDVPDEMLDLLKKLG